MHRCIRVQISTNKITLAPLECTPMADFTVIFKVWHRWEQRDSARATKRSPPNGLQHRTGFPVESTRLASRSAAEHWCVDQAFHAIGQSGLRIAHNAEGKPEAIDRPEIHVSIAHPARQTVAGQRLPAAIAPSARCGGRAGPVAADRPRFLSESERAALGTARRTGCRMATKECMFALDRAGFPYGYGSGWCGLESAEASGVAGHVRGREGRCQLGRLQTAGGQPPVWALGPVRD